MHPILARALSAPKPPVAGTQEPISAQDFDLRDVYEASPVGGIIGPLSDLYYSTKGRSTPEEQKEADKAQQPAKPVDGTRTPEQTKELNKLLGRDYKSVGIEGVSAPEAGESGFKDAEITTYGLPNGISAKDFDIPGFKQSDVSSDPYSLPIPGIEDLSYTTPTSDVPDNSIMHAVKHKGGNWIEGEIDKAIDDMKLGATTNDWETEDRTDPAADAVDIRREIQEVHDNPQINYELLIGQTREEYLEHLNASLQDNEVRAEINDWLDTKFHKYMRNEMGTPADPVRDMAMSGIFHVNAPNEYGDYSSLLSQPLLDIADKNRMSAARFDPDFETPMEGYAGEGYTDAAQFWETATDAAIKTENVEEYINRLSDENYNDAAIAKKTPSWMLRDIHGTALHSYSGAALGMHHVTDELTNAMNPDSGLPQDLYVAPGKLSKMSVPEVFTHIHKINDWRSKNLAEADKEKAFNRATHPIEGFQYDDHGWVELRDPDDMSGNKDDLQTSLSYEGDTMGHCVEGYCDDVRFRGTKIFSLRDSKGEPHVTIEAKLDMPRDVEESYDDTFDQIYFQHRSGAYPNEPMTRSAFWNKIKTEWIEKNPEKAVLKIHQVKGKGNKKVSDKYIDMVQDFLTKQNVEFDNHPYATYGKGDIESAQLINLTGGNYYNLPGLIYVVLDKIMTSNDRREHYISDIAEDIANEYTPTRGLVDARKFNKDIEELYIKYINAN